MSGGRVLNMAQCKINVRFFRPPPELEGCFSSFYRAEFDIPEGGFVRDRLQPEWGNTRFFRDAAPDASMASGAHLVGAAFTATGPSAMLTDFTLGNTRLWGIGYFPLGWAKFIGAPASELANCVVDGRKHPAFADFLDLSHSLYGDTPDDEAEYARIIGHFMARADRVVPDQEKIAVAHAALVEPDLASVADFASRAGLTPRTLERICRRYFGFTPRLLLRRQRFMRSLAAYMLDPSISWTTAIDGRYHDQAHFVRDFHHFMGMSPSEYAALDHPILAAFMRERAQVWGAAAQTLDKPVPLDKAVP